MYIIIIIIIWIILGLFLGNKLSKLVDNPQSSTYNLDRILTIIISVVFSPGILGFAIIKLVFINDWK